MGRLVGEHRSIAGDSGITTGENVSAKNDRTAWLVRCPSKIMCR
jgi:hypothetical protein